jgi:hypothetical protein
MVARPNPSHQNPARRSIPTQAISTSAEGFEFDDAMLRPGYGSNNSNQGAVDALPPANTQPRAQANGRGRGTAHGHGHGGHLPMRGRGGFRPPPPPQHHHHVAPIGPARPLVPSTPAFTPAAAAGIATAPASGPTLVPGFIGSMNWQPAAPSQKVVLQRPT